MLVKLSVDNISHYWEDIYNVISGELPPIAIASKEGEAQLLESLLKGTMDCFFLVGETYEHSNHIYGVVTTTVQEDACTGNRTMLIYTMSNIDVIPQHLWKEMEHTLVSEARAKGCLSISFYSNNKKLVGYVANMFEVESMYYITVNLDRNKL